MPSATTLDAQLLAGTRTAYAPDVEGWLTALADADTYYGYENLATIHGEIVPAEIMTSSEEEIQVAGGRADKGFAKVRVAIPLFSTVPKQGDAAVILDATKANYVSAEVLRIWERLGNLWTLMIGDSSAMDRRMTNIR